jgi:hypothetical protein
MENHPIPQDITGFQFKLIGDMTIKQFAYLASGVILGWIAFILPVFPLIKIPIALVFVGLGVAAAFVPIEGRPFDTMIINYFKALFSPTVFIYQKTGGHMWFPEATAQASAQVTSSHGTPESSQRLKQFLSSLPQKPKDKLDEKELSFLNSLNAIHQSSPPPSGASVLTGLKIAQKEPPKTIEKPPEQKPQPKENLEDKEEELKREIEQAKALEKERAGSKDSEVAHQKVSDLEMVLADVMKQKQNLESQLLDLKKKIDMQGQKVFAPSEMPVREESKQVRVIPKTMGKTSGLPFVPDVPNLVMGIIKDPRDNPIANVLIEVKDESGNPVRAFKTNVLGQFASATPLSNGTFQMYFEDPKGEHKFDAVEIKATGEVLMPLEIISVDAREELRRTLFTNPPAQAGQAA